MLKHLPAEMESRYVHAAHPRSFCSRLMPAFRDCSPATRGCCWRRLSSSNT
jgi:hypothetical protein